MREVRTPSMDKREKKPIWNYGRNSGKQENVVYKCIQLIMQLLLPSIKISTIRFLQEYLPEEILNKR